MHADVGTIGFIVALCAVLWVLARAVPRGGEHAHRRAARQMAVRKRLRGDARMPRLRGSHLIPLAYRGTYGRGPMTAGRYARSWARAPRRDHKSGGTTSET